MTMKTSEFLAMADKAFKTCGVCKRVFTTPRGRKVHESRKKHYGTVIK